MFCPRCGEEYRQGFTRCADCGVVLGPCPVIAAPSDRESDTETDADIESDCELVRVYESRHPAGIMVTESILGSSKIPFSKQGQAMLDLYGWAPVAFLVRARDENAARALLADVDEADLDTGAFGPDMEDEGPCSRRNRLQRTTRPRRLPGRARCRGSSPGDGAA